MITVSHPTFCCVGVGVLVEVGLGCDNKMIFVTSNLFSYAKISKTWRITIDLLYCGVWDLCLLNPLLRRLSACTALGLSDSADECRSYSPVSSQYKLPDKAEFCLIK